MERERFDDFDTQIQIEEVINEDSLDEQEQPPPDETE